ncbi:MAG: gliding motility-associated C-terminal domain-containing protein [Sphingobacteriales bacterium]|nr:gliding motility-associated C-terminal domain-containing protein [Sphingobacteriales bacterium]
MATIQFAGGSVQLWASGGTTYSWSPSNGLSNANISNPTASPSATTTYTVTISNAQGCSDTEQVTVTVNDPVYGSAGVNGGNNTICAGGSVQLWASGGTTYSWSPSNGLSNANISNPTASPSATTTYTVTITNANGCSDTEQVIVTVNDPVYGSAGVNGGNNTICAGGSVQLWASGGTTYSWSPSNGLSNANISNPTASPSATTIYTVTITNAQGCSDTEQVTVTVNDPVYGSAGVNGGNNTICAGGSVQLWASGGTTYSWSPSNGLSNANIANPTASPSATTTYTVTITNANGCSDTEQVTVTVNEPVYGSAGVNGGNNTICAGGSVQLWASGGTTYSWSPSNGLSNANIANPTASPSATTTYTVTISNAQGCSDTEQVTVTVNEPVYGNAGGDGTICAGGSVQLWASGGTTYSWSPSNGLSNANIANPTASPSATTTYTVTISNAQGCSDTEQVTVTVNEPVYGNAGGDGTICAGGSVQLWASGGTTYSWSPSNGLSNANIANPTSSPSATTIYTVTITNANGCSDTEEVTVIVAPASNASAGADVTICEGEDTQLNASGGTTYSWSPATGLSNPNIANPIASPSTTTTYTVTVTNAQGCSDTDQVTVTVLPPVVLNAGNDMAVCGHTAVLQASGNGYWTVEPSNGVSISNINDPHATVTVPADGFYAFNWNTSGAVCGNSFDQVIVQFGSNPTPANAGPDATTCGLSYTMNANAPYVGMGTWIGNGIFSNSTDPHATVTVAVPGTYAFTWITTNCTCAPSSDLVFITFGQGSGVNAGADQTICAGESVQLNASGGANYSWSPTVGLSNPNIANPVANPAATTTYAVTSTDAGGCVSVDYVTVTVNNGSPVNAGTDDSTCGLNYMLNATGSGTWSAVGGGISFSNNNDPHTMVTVSSPGYYVFTWTANGGGACGGGNDQVAITFTQYDATAYAGASATVESLTYTLNANTPQFATGTWSGVDGAVFANVNNPNTTVTVPAYSTYIFTWTINNNGDCDDAVATVSITFNAPTPTCEISAGGLISSSTNTWCAGADNATVTVLSSGSTGDNLKYLVTKSNGEIILISNSSTFTISSATATTLRVYSVVYTGSINGLNVGDNLSAVSGACFDISDTYVSFIEDCTPVCTANGGTLSAAPINICANDAIANTINVSTTGASGANHAYVVTNTQGTILSVSNTATVTLSNTIGTYLIWSISYENGLQGLTTGASAANLEGCFDLSNSVSVNVIDCETPCQDVLEYCTTPQTLINICLELCDMPDANITELTSLYDCSVNIESAHCFSYIPLPAFVNLTDHVTVTYCDAVGNCNEIIINIYVGNCDGTPEPCTIQANAGVDQGICPGGSVTLSGSGGTSYAWSPATGLSNAGIANPVASPTATTTYTLTVTDANGCSDTDEVTVTVGNTFTGANAGADQTLCAGLGVLSTQLNASGGTSYAWSPTTGLSNPNIANPIVSNITQSITYTVTVTSAQGCTDTDQVTITVGNAPEFTVGTPVCNSNNASYSVAVNATGGTGAYIAVVEGANNYTQQYNFTGNGVNISLPLNSSGYIILVKDAQTDCSGYGVSINAPQGCGTPEPSDCVTFQSICAEPVEPQAVCLDLCGMEESNVEIIEAETTYNCSITILGGACLQYTALPAFQGVDTIRITMCTLDGTMCEHYDVEVMVGICEGLAAADDDIDFDGNNGSQSTFNILENDINANNAVVSAFTQPQNGTIIVAEDGTVVYSPVSGFDGNDSFTYTVTDAQGNVSTAIVYLNILQPYIAEEALKANCRVEVPNAFSPNNDGVNDVFFVDKTNCYPQYKFTVVNRWGDIVCQKQGTNRDDLLWDGCGNADGKAVVEGVYFYFLELQSESGETETLNGFIEVKR